MEIRLRNGSSSAMILDKGAELRSLIINGKELMWCADPAFWGKSSPVLFPMIGNLHGGKTLINGKEYHITKHGFARDHIFNVDENSDNKAVFSFKATNETKQSYPFDFILSLEYVLHDDCSLSINYCVTNLTDSPMPFCIGAHPAFACPNEECSDFSDYRLIFAEPETVRSPVMNLDTRMWGDNNRITRLENSTEFGLNHKLFDNDCVYFDTIRSKSVKLVSKKSGRGVQVEWKGFETLGVWTPDHKNAPFICIEPWCGCDDYDTDDGVFEHKRGIQIAAPDSKLSYSVRIASV